MAQTARAAFETLGAGVEMDKLDVLLEGPDFRMETESRESRSHAATLGAELADCADRARLEPHIRELRSGLVRRPDRDPRPYTAPPATNAFFNSSI
jgi:hypothetical protein